MAKRSLVSMIVAVVLVLGVASPASAALCRKRIVSYWGYVYPDTVSCNPVVWPVLPAEIIGQTIRECDDSIWSWGNTSCTYVTPTIEYEDCPPCSDDPMGSLSPDEDVRPAEAKACAAAD
jgi:hypothetical protein